MSNSVSTISKEIWVNYIIPEISDDLKDYKKLFNFKNDMNHNKI